MLDAPYDRIEAEFRSLLGAANGERRPCMLSRHCARADPRLQVHALAVFAGSCRYTPGCADYMSESITRYGVLRGGWLGTKRLCRCHPLGGHGFDPGPARSKRSNIMERRVLLAITLSFLVLFLFQRFVMPPPAPLPSALRARRQRISGHRRCTWHLRRRRPEHLPPMHRQPQPQQAPGTRRSPRPSAKPTPARSSSRPARSRRSSRIAARRSSTGF